MLEKCGRLSFPLLAEALPLVDTGLIRSTGADMRDGDEGGWGVTRAALRKAALWAAMFSGDCTAFWDEARNSVIICRPAKSSESDMVLDCRLANAVGED